MAINNNKDRNYSPEKKDTTNAINLLNHYEAFKSIEFFQKAFKTNYSTKILEVFNRITFQSFEPNELIFK